MGPFKRYITSIMAFFTPFNFVTLCQFYCTTSPVPFTKLHQETIEREGKRFFAYMATSAYHVISTEVENHIFKHVWIFTSHVFKNLKMLKFTEKVTLKNCILIFKYFNQALLKTFKNWFTLATVSHTHNTRWSNSGCLEISSHKTRVYGRHSNNMNAIYSGNYLQKLHVNILFMNYQKQSSGGVL